MCLFFFFSSCRWHWLNHNKNNYSVFCFLFCIQKRIFFYWSHLTSARWNFKARGRCHTSEHRKSWVRADVVRTAMTRIAFTTGVSFITAVEHDNVVNIKQSIQETEHQQLVWCVCVWSSIGQRRFEVVLKCVPAARTRGWSVFTLHLRISVVVS